MNHTNTSDVLKIITSSGADIDVVLNYVIQGQLVEKNDYTKITTATTTTIALPDSGSSLITSLYLKNIDGSTSNTIGIYKTFGGVDYLKFGCALAAGECIIYTQERGWVVYTATGKQKVETGSGGGSTAWGDLTGTLSDQTDLQAALDLKAPIASPTFTGTVSGITKAMVGLSNVDNTSDANKPVSTLQAAGDAAAQAAAEAYADGLVVGLWDDRGNYDPTATSDYPASGGSGTAGAILKGDIWTVSVAGTISGNTVNIGDVVRALVDTPGLTDANWAIGENNIGYVPENVANKDATGGYAGLTLFKINFKNAANTFTSFFTNSNTAARTYTFQNRDGTIADDTDLALKAPIASPTFTGTVSGITSAMVGLGNVDNTSDATKNSATVTLTNKTLTSTTNIFATVTTIASSATPTPTGDGRENELYVTALAANAVFAAPSGTPANGNKITIRVKDDGTPRTLGYNAIYRFIDVTGPTTTIANKTLYMAGKYNSADSTVDILAVGQEA
jgi:hypothetical protein